MSECVKVLMKLGADPLLTDNKGRSGNIYICYLIIVSLL